GQCFSWYATADSKAGCGGSDAVAKIGRKAARPDRAIDKNERPQPRQRHGPKGKNVMNSEFDAAIHVQDSTLDDPARRLHGIMTIQRLFDAAAMHGLKFPKIRLVTADGSVVVLHRAGPKSTFYGLIVATDDERYPNSAFYGRY